MQTSGILLAAVEPYAGEDCTDSSLRYRFPHVPARLTKGARRRRLKIPETWPWAAAIAAVFANIAAIPQLT